MKISIQSIAEPPVYLRDVDEQSTEFRELRDSIRSHGLHNSILVRLTEGGYQLVDGAWRLAACRSLGLTEIDAIVREMSDQEVLVTQVQANAIRKETTRTEYAKQLLRIKHAMPEITMAELAKLAGKNSYWVRQQLDLLNLRLEYQAEVDRGLLPLMQAYSLAKLPHHIQGRFVDRARVMEPKEFKQLVADEITRLQSNAKDRSEQKRLAARTSAEPHPYMRQLSELRRELETREAARKVIADTKPTNALEAFELGIRWALHVDPLSLEERREKLAEQEISRVIKRTSEL